MPNHVTNILSFEGPEKDIKALKDSIKSFDEYGKESAIDFNKIILMPPSMDISKGSMVDFGIAIIKLNEENDDTELRKMLDWPWVKSENIITPKQLADFLIEKDKVNMHEARIAFDNIKKYGFKDWYSWCVAHWGTKWNAYEAYDEEGIIHFYTAYGAPLPAVSELSKKFPTVKIKIEYADEDFGYNCGVVVFLAGNTIEKNIPKDGSAEAYRIAAKIQGGEIEDLMYHICDSDNEEFIKILLDTILELHTLKTFEHFIKTEEPEMFSETFLNTAKAKLIEMEAYEHIAVIDEKLKLKVGEE